MLLDVSNGGCYASRLQEPETLSKNAQNCIFKQFWIFLYVLYIWTSPSAQTGRSQPAEGDFFS